MTEKKPEEIPKNILNSLKDKSPDEKSRGMKLLCDFFKNQIVSNGNEECLFSYVDKFNSLSEAKNSPSERESAFLGYICLINAIRDKGKDENKYEKIFNLIVENTLNNLQDGDKMIILSSADCLFDLLNKFPNYVLLHFKDFLEGLLKLVTKQEDSKIEKLSQNFDSTLKSAVNYAFQGELPNGFDLVNFVNIIIENITKANNAIKCTIVSWISCINQIPEIKLINVLDTFIDELFNMLKDEKSEVNKCAEDCLKDFYGEVNSNFNNIPYEVTEKILNTLIAKSKIELNSNESEEKKNAELNCKLKAYNWISLFLQKYYYIIIRSTKNNNSNYNNNIINNNKNTLIKNKIYNTPKEFYYESDPSKIDDISVISRSSYYENEWKLLFKSFGEILETLVLSSQENEELKKEANNINSTLLNIVENSGECNANIKLFEDVLKKYFDCKDINILKLVFNWIEKLFIKFHGEAFSNFDEFMEKFTIIITHEKIEVFNEALDMFNIIAKYKEEYIESIISNIINKLKERKDLLKNRGSDIVTKLTSTFKVDKVYLTFANVLVKMKDTEFVGRMINILDIFLLKSKETEELRNLLKNVKKSGNNKEKQFFENLFKTWCINPVSCLILCLIAEYFELSYYLLIKFGELKFSQESYLELAQLVQLLESNVFINIRIYLLEPKKNKYLIKTLYGILLILPQGNAYQALLRRLKHMEIMLKLDKKNYTGNEENQIDQNEIAKYMNIFESIHNSLKDKQNTKSLSNKPNNKEISNNKEFIKSKSSSGSKELNINVYNNNTEEKMETKEILENNNNNTLIQVQLIINNILKQ